MTTALVRKELVALWVSPLPWVAGAAFQAVLGLLVVDQLHVRQQAVVQPLFPIAGLLVLVTVPVLTMRTVAEEARSGSLDLLLAVPVPARPLVVGKWLAAWLTAGAVVAPAALLAGLTALWGDPDTGPVVTGFAGLALLAAAIAAVGVLASASTSSPPVAGLATALAGLVLWFVGGATTAVSAGSLLRALSLSERLRTFAAGGIDLGDLVFFTALVVGSLAVAVLLVDARRLR